MHSRFALLSHVLPPSPSGQAVMLYRILGEVSKDAYYLIHSQNLPREESNASDLFHLQAQCYSLPAETLLSRPRYFGLGYVRNKLNLLLQIYVRAKNIVDILRREPETTALVACSGNFADIPAASLAGRMLRLPFYAYVFDDYVFQWTGSQRWIARWMAPFIFKHSAGIIGPNEFICEAYERRYHIKTAVVRNPCDRLELNKEHDVQSYAARNDKTRITYTGAVYHANLDCFRNLIQAMRSLPEHPVELYIFTAQTQEELRSHDIYGEGVVVHSHMPYSKILEEQRKTDILFLPLAFESPIPEVIRTSAPGKLGEYLASGRPVLAHVPDNSFVAYYLEKNQCGLVASENNPASLKDHILKLIDDENLCRVITRNARERARLDFDPRVASERFLGFLSENTDRTH